MKVLLDTHIWIWWVMEQQNLSAEEREALSIAAELREASVSAISLWEVQMLHAKGRLRLNEPFEQWLLQATVPEIVQIIPLDVPVVLALRDLPDTFHGDPADRIIVATARAFDLPLATRDRAIRRSRTVRLWSA